MCWSWLIRAPSSAFLPNPTLHEVTLAAQYWPRWENLNFRKQQMLQIRAPHFPHIFSPCHIFTNTTLAAYILPASELWAAQTLSFKPDARSPFCRNSTNILLPERHCQQVTWALGCLFQTLGHLASPRIRTSQQVSSKQVRKSPFFWSSSPLCHPMKFINRLRLPSAG